MGEVMLNVRQNARGNWHAGLVRCPAKNVFLMGRNFDVLCGSDFGYSVSVGNLCMLCCTLYTEDGDWND